MSLQIKDLESKIQFPVARKHIREGYIVIFISERRGHVVFADEDSTHNIAYHRDDWPDSEDCEVWTPVELIITG